MTYKVEKGIPISKSLPTRRSDSYGLHALSEIGDSLAIPVKDELEFRKKREHCLSFASRNKIKLTMRREEKDGQLFCRVWRTG